MKDLPEPTAAYIATRMQAHDEKTEYFAADSTLNLVFEQWPSNTSKDQVLAKVLVLDSLYSTNVYYPEALATHILRLNIDDALREGDPSLVQRIAILQLPDRLIRYYSFATKYCSFHNPSAYHIYDSYIDALLWEYCEAFAFSRFSRKNLKSYGDFAVIIRDFVHHFGLQHLSPKQLDKFLWIEGIQRYVR